MSMVCNHLAPDSLINRALHAPLFIDGAMGFFFLSGFVLGMVHLRRSRKMGESAALKKVFARAVQIYRLHLVLAFAAIGLCLSFGIFGPQPTVESLGGWLPTIGATLLMWFEPPFMDILPMYVVFIAGAVPLLWILKRYGYALPILLIASLYGAAHFAGEWLRMRIPLPGHEGGSLHLAAWQALFLGGLLIGYAKENGDLAMLTKHLRTLTIASAIALAACFLLAQLQRPAFARFESLQLPAWTVDKTLLGPFAMVYFFFAALPLYQLMNWTMGLVPAFTETLADFGRASLYTYLLHFLLLAILMAGGLLAAGAGVQDAVALAALPLLWFAARRRLWAQVIPN